MSAPCPNHPNRHLVELPHHEPMLLASGVLFEPYNPPGCTVIVEKETDADAIAAYGPHIDAWKRVSASGRVGVCRHCRMLVLFDVADLSDEQREPFTIKRIPE